MSSEKPDPAEGQDVVRDLAAPMRAELPGPENRVTPLAIAVVCVAAAVLVGVVVWGVIALRPIVRPEPDAAVTPTVVATDGASLTVELPEPDALVTPSVVNADGGISVGRDGVAGSVTEGAPVVDLYFDYMCVWCGTFEETNGALLTELRESGDVTIVFHPVSILDRLSLGSAFSTRAAAAAVWVAEEAPAQFDAFSTAMFASQPAGNTVGLTDGQIAEIAEAAGVPAEVAEGIAAQDAYRTYARWVGARTDAAGKNEKLMSELDDGTRRFSTPTILVGGRKLEGDWREPGVLRAAIDAAATVELPTPGPLTIPSVVNADGGISVGRDGLAGSVTEGAPVVDLYLDFMCVWCGVFEETNGALVKQWREAGDVTVVYHPVAILDRFSQGTAFSTRSATAALWVAEKSPAQFDAFVTAMFAAQPEENSKGLTDREIADIAQSAGVPAEVADGIAAQDAYTAYAAWVGAQTETVSQNEKVWTTSQDGRQGFSTPTVVIGGEKFEGDWRDQPQLRAAVDAAATNG